MTYYGDADSLHVLLLAPNDLILLRTQNPHKVNSSREVVMFNDVFYSSGVTWPWLTSFLFTRGIKFTTELILGMLLHCCLKTTNPYDA